MRVATIFNSISLFLLCILLSTCGEFRPTSKTTKTVITPPEEITDTRVPNHPSPDETQIAISGAFVAAMLDRVANNGSSRIVYRKVSNTLISLIDSSEKVINVQRTNFAGNYKFLLTHKSANFPLILTAEFNDFIYRSII